MEISGKIKFIGDTQEVGKGGFKKRELVVTTSDRFPQHIMVEFTQNNAALLDDYNVGDDVTVQIDIRGREWTSPQGETKYFNSINGWRIERGARATTSAAASGTSAPSAGNFPPPPPIPEAGNSGDDTDDLPF